jgi:serine/threonine protein phosphatase PrpC
MAFQSDIAGAQIDGARDYQEDAFLITHLTDANGDPSSLIIVADGMGGHAAGNVASNMAVQAFNKSITTLYPTETLSEALNISVLKANAAITDTVKETPALDGMGCTFVGVIIEGKNMWWVSVGDSHLYLLRDRTLTKLNEDHSYGGFLDRMEAAGSPVDIEPGLSRNMLMSAITGADIAEIDCPSSPFTLEHDDKLVICSDGLDTLSEGKIIQYSDWADSPKECADALMSAVEDAAMPRQDNTTAVVVKIIDDGLSEPAPVEEDDDDDDGDMTDPGEGIVSTTAEIEELSETIEEEIVETPEEIVETPEEIVDLTPDETPVDSDTDIDDVSDSAEKSKTGLIIGIAAIVLVALIVGAYLMFGGSKPDEAVIQTDPDEVEQEETISDEASSEETLIC